MKRFRNILFYFNPDLEQDAALRRAATVARQNGARLTLLSVHRMPGGEMPDTRFGKMLGELRTQTLEELESRLADLESGLEKEGVDVQTSIVAGTPFIEIIRRVQGGGHDLVILTADGKQSFISKLFGSTSMHLMRKCPCPVWVIKADDRRAYRRILAAVDTEDDIWGENDPSINTLILQLASSLAAMDNCELHVLQAWSVAFEGYLKVRGNMDETAQRKLRRDTRRDYLQRIETLVHGVDLTGVASIHNHVVHGDDPASVITRLARREKIDLLVMGTLCRSGLAGFLIGNTAEEVLSRVNCSVLTVKPEGFVSPVTANE